MGITAVAQWLMNTCNNKMTYGIVRDIRKDAFDKIEILPLGYVDTHFHGEIVSKVIADVDQFAEGLLLGFTQLFSGIVTILCTLIFMVKLNWTIAVVVVVITPLSLYMASFIAKRTFNLFKKQSQIRSEQTALIDEMIGEHKTVVAFGYEDKAIDRFDEINNRLEKTSLKAIFFSSLTNPSTRFVNAVVYAFVAFAGAMICASLGGEVLKVGMLSSFLSYATQYTKPFNEISGVVTELQNALASADRVFDLIESPSQEDVIDNGDIIKNAEIEFCNVSFSYVPEKPLITNFNFKAEAGTHVAIVGPTGCGKTTLINLLMRFYDVNEGSIRLGGKDIRNIERSELRKRYGMVLQETWLQTGTIRDNVAMGKPDATLEEVIEACKASHAHSFIKRLPQGYDTVVSEENCSLSAGQKQLLCIARIMLCLPPMLILDEATSSIDTRTELKIQDAFAKLMKGRTSFIVAHRLSTIRDADLILVMKNGKVIEQGNHESLLEKKGFYYDLYNA
jgi:ATP-binding cassette subfamily B protein